MAEFYPGKSPKPPSQAPERIGRRPGLIERAKERAKAFLPIRELPGIVAPGGTPGEEPTDLAERARAIGRAARGEFGEEDRFGKEEKQ